MHMFGGGGGGGGAFRANVRSFSVFFLLSLLLFTVFGDVRACPFLLSFVPGRSTTEPQTPTEGAPRVSLFLFFSTR